VTSRVAPGLALWAALLIVAAGCGGDDPPSATAAATSTTAPAPAPVTTVPPTSEGTSTTASSEPKSTFPPVSSTTVAPTFELSGATLEVASPLLTNPFLLERVGEFGELVVYDGLSTDGDFSLRCVAVGREGDTAWTEWCALPGDSSTFAMVDGADPWVAEVGPELGDVVLTMQPATWSLTASGCDEPLVMHVAAFDLVHPVAVTNAACADDLAVLTYSGVYMQPGSGDGGAVLLSHGDEGWNTVASGTSMPCTDLSAECQSFGVDTELFDATTPIPAPDQLPAQEQFVNVRDVTVDIAALADDAPDSDSDEGADIEAVTEAIVSGLTPPDAEVGPTTTRHDGVSFARYSLLVVDVPAMDDSVTSTTWVAWITTATPEVPATVHRAYAWDICGRGVADPDTCV
jgi:hypothetical protein